MLYAFVGYGLRYVTNLNKKGPHLFMLGLITSSGLFYFLAGILLFFGLNSAQAMKILNAVIVLNSLGWLSNLLVHALFVAFYFTVCRKVEEIAMRRVPNPKIGIQGRYLCIFLSVFATAVVAAFTVQVF